MAFGSFKLKQLTEPFFPSLNVDVPHKAYVIQFLLEFRRYTILSASLAANPYTNLKPI